MRNLNGYLKKTLWILLIFSLFVLLKPNNRTLSQTTFDVKTEISHSIDKEIINTTIYYTISSSDTPRVITYYTTTVPQEDIKPEVYLSKDNQKIEPTYHSRKGATDIVIDLKNAVVSPESPLTLKLVYSQELLQGPLTLLSGIKDTQTTKMILSYPKELGDVTWSSTPITTTNTQGNISEVIIESPQAEKTNITFNSGVSYTFSISRNLLNSSDEMFKSEIILPPNTNSQRVIITDYSPKPNNSYKDSNGNYILQYELAPQSNLPVSVNGYLLMQPNETSLDTYLTTESQDYWKLSDSVEKIRLNKYLQKNGLIEDINFENISELDDSKKELFYKLVHSYTLERLQPNTLTIGSLTGGVRVGADATLTTSTDSTAEDYCDTIIAILREYGVPARFVIGYITDISDYNPGGMYSTWIEYYNLEERNWILLDPFLEDYMNISLVGRQLPDHVAIIYRNTNPNTPKLPYFGENDLIIKTSTEKQEIKYDIESRIHLLPFNISDSHLKGYINIKNIGNSIIDSIQISKSNPTIEQYLDMIENSGNKILLPQEEMNIYFNIPSQQIDSTIFSVVKGLSDTSQTEEKYVQTELDILKTDGRLKVLTQLISILLYSILFVPIYLLFIKLKKKYG
jgi:hypothetical protein